MRRRIPLELKAYSGASLLAAVLSAVLAAGVLSAPADVQAGDAGVPAHAERPVVARPVVAMGIAVHVVANDASADVAAFMHEIEASTGSKAVRGLIRSTVGGQSATGAPVGSSSPRVTVPDVPAAQQRQLTPADGDNHFARWQRDADERLKAEKSLAIAKPHPLMLAHPEKAVVVCEAGCRTTQDEIVYMAAYVPAIVPAAVPARTFEPASSGAASASAAEPAGDMPCIAGCYEKPQRNMPAPRRSASINGAAPRAVVSAVPSVQVIAAAVAAVMRPARLKPAAVRVAKFREAGFNGAIVQVRSRVPSKAIERAALKTKSRHAALSGWRTKIIVAKALDWTAVVRPAVLKRAKPADRIRRVARNGWRTSVVFSQRVRHTTRH